MLFKKNPELTKTLNVEGMMCENCEKHVKEALENVSGVKKAKADHKEKTVKIILSKPISDEELKNAVKEAGYEVV